MMQKGTQPSNQKPKTSAHAKKRRRYKENKRNRRREERAKQDQARSKSPPHKGQQRNATPRPRPRPLPNIAITGTPGVGKSTLARALVARLQPRHPAFYHCDFAAKAELQGFLKEYDQSRASWIIDEHRAAAELSDELARDGGAVVDWIHADQFAPAPEGPMDLVLTLRIGTADLYDRLMGRGYEERKVVENIDAEIMGVVAEENVKRFGELVLEGFEDENRLVGEKCEVWERWNNVEAAREDIVEEVGKWVERFLEGTVWVRGER